MRKKSGNLKSIKVLSELSKYKCPALLITISKHINSDNAERLFDELFGMLKKQDLEELEVSPEEV